MRIIILVALLIPLSYCSKSFLCDACINTIEFLKTGLLSNTTRNLVGRIYVLFCSIKRTKDYCEKTLKNKVNPLYRAGVNIVDSDEICTKTSLCTHISYVPDKFKDFIGSILHDNPPLISNKMSIQTANRLKILVVTDVHIDYAYIEGKSAICEESICCRNTSRNESNDKNKAGKFGFVGKCDIPLITAQSFTDYAIKEVKPDIVLFLGDILPHNGWEQAAEVHYKGLREFTGLLEKFKVPVYPVLGNHEGHPSGNFDLKENGEHQWAVDEVLDIWKNLFTKEIKESFKKNGCYSTLIKGTNLRIIALTPFAQVADNLYIRNNPADPANVV